MIRRAFRYLFFTLLAAIAVFGALYAFFGLRVQADGTGMPRHLYFDRQEDHLASLEKRSAEDHSVKAAELPPDPAPSAPAPEATSAANVPAAIQEAPAAVPSWPLFYGPLQDGHYKETTILTTWPSAGLKQVWKRPVGGGYASMTVAGNRVFTIEQRRDREATVAYDLATGRELWVNEWKAFFQESMGGDGPRATPAYHNGRVYALGAEGEFRCLDAATGRTLWRKNILSDNGATNIQWGMSASPLVADGMVVVLPGGSGGKSVAAYDLQSGAPRWTALDDKAAYTAPILATLNGQRQLVIVSASRVVGLSLDGKSVLWQHPWVTDYDVNSALPVVVAPDRLLLTAGYGHGSALLQITPTGAKELWQSKSMKAKFNNVVEHEGVIYGLDEGILAAMDLKTGERKWKGGRYGYGQLLFASGHLVILTEQGDVVLVKADPTKHQEIARFTAIEGKTWNVPALAQGKLLVRNQTEMACYQIAP
jgi:outer membrane protein assembly factor BamB